MTPSQQSKICDNNISRDQGTNTSPQLVLDSEAADHTRKVSEALMRMELEESAPSSPREENISDRSGQATPPLHWDCVESASPRQVAVAPNGDCEGHKRDVLDLVDEAFGGFSDEDKRRKQRVEEIVRTSDHSQGGVGSPKDNLVAALDMKPRRSVCYKEGGKESSVWFGEEHDESAPSVSVSLPSLHASLPTTMSPRQACRPSRSILRKADSEPFNMSILRKFDSESLPSPKNIQEIHRRNELRRQVTFHSVTIREYPMTVGDHPNCSYGPPVSLGWDYDEYESIDMNYFETHRPHRRNLRQMMLNYYHRKNMLLHWGGYSQEELDMATVNAKRVKKQRNFTSTFMPAFLVQEATSGAVRKVRKVVLKKARKKESQSSPRKQDKR
uniref:Uncharacterized protein n=1 Tax=Odontella aurita TaxID=265563 RepID=A0A7S4KCJ7_9STRA|mmetsp:Transcript_9453/g.28419  ORF Transcript_9453/g.28419 Transcript_9453/m.28419 type:complete len:386 (+) Transcript_9453:401-1558(+)